MSGTLVVTDLDGTFWGNSCRCSADTRAALAEMERRSDVELLIATGRRPRSCARALAANDIVVPTVTLNGAVGEDPATGTRFLCETFAAADLSLVVDTLRDCGVAPVAYLADDRALAVEGATTSRRHLDRLGSDLMWGSFEDLAGRDDVLGMSVLGIEADLVAEPLARLGDEPAVQAAGYADSYYPPFSFMVGPGGVTKASGVEAWMAYRGIRPDRVIALGDGGNDLEMLEAADLALVVVGGDRRAIALSDRLIGHPDEGGWSEVLDDL